MVRKLIGIYQMYQCVAPQDIQDYFDGRLKRKDREAYNRTIAHLGVCEKCQRRLESLAQANTGEEDISSHLVE